jgi:hypothetical protein
VAPDCAAEVVGEGVCCGTCKKVLVRKGEGGMERPGMLTPVLVLSGWARASATDAEGCATGLDAPEDGWAPCGDMDEDEDEVWLG